MDSGYSKGSSQQQLRGQSPAQSPPSKGQRDAGPGSKKSASKGSGKKNPSTAKQTQQTKQTKQAKEAKEAKHAKTPGVPGEPRKAAKGASQTRASKPIGTPQSRKRG